MEYKYPKLFTEGNIGRLEIKNRTVMPAMGTLISSITGEPNEHIIRYYEERAKGGCGLIITEITRVDEMHGAGMFQQIRMSDARYVSAIQRLVNTVHKYDTKLFLQLHHPGREGNPALQDGRELIAPTAIASPVSGLMPREMTTEECKRVVQCFVLAAVYAQMADCDGVDIHGAHGYLLSLFLSPHTNKRTDEYGGSLENRARIACEIVGGIKQACGANFPVTFRLSGDEFIEGGNHPVDTAKIAKLLEQAGADAINVSKGTYETLWATVEDYYHKPGWCKHISRTIKENVNIPVIAVNNVKDPADAEKLLEEGVSDFIALGRAQLADPNWVEKARLGQDEDIRPCIGCINCFKEEAYGKPFKCSVNAKLGREVEFNEEKETGNGRSVAVIGGGPAGMEAARILGNRGFKVDLYEKNNRLGGTLNVADKATSKERITLFKEWLIRQMEHENISIHLEAEADIRGIKERNPYAVFVCVGAKPIIPRLPGIDRENVYTAESVLTGDVKLRDAKVVIIGAGVTGVETAEVIGKNNKVTIIEMLPEIKLPLHPMLAAKILGTLSEMGVETLTGHKLISVDDTGVNVEKMESGEHIKLEADAVILSLGSKPDKEFVRQIRHSFKYVKVCGDAKGTGQIIDAVREGYERGYVLE